MARSYSINNEIIYLKVENAYAVWFKASRSFLMIEEPAFYMLKLLLKHISLEKIIQNFSNRYQNPVSEVRPFVIEINQHLQQYLSPSKKEIFVEKESDDDHFPNKSYYTEKAYSINNLGLTICYGDKELEYVIHPLIAQHETDKNDKSGHLFEIYRLSEKLFLKVNGEVIETLNFEETGYLKAAVLLKLLGILYGIESENWMMTVHAAAVTDGDSAIVFPAMAGSGKSTLATLLHAHGFSLLSDDFLAVDIPNKHVYQLPVAATIKQGSFDVLTPHYPELNEIVLERAYTGKQVRYLPVSNSINTNKGFAAKNFVFVTYSEDNTFSFEKVSKKKALQSLLEETWVNPTPSIVTEFFNWFDKTTFFELKYTKTSDALGVVSSLFKR